MQLERGSSLRSSAWNNEVSLKESNSLGIRNNTRKMPQILKMPRGGEKEEEKKAKGMTEDNYE